MKDCCEDLYNIETQEPAAVYMCGFIETQEPAAVYMFGFYSVWRGNYLGGKLVNTKAVGKVKVTGEMVKGGGDMVVDWI